MGYKYSHTCFVLSMAVTMYEIILCLFFIIFFLE